jgi:hypothetical protein
MANLPPWGRDDLPEPLPFSFRNALRTIGPGAILLATAIGGGEWLVGPSISIKHGVGIMWIATLGIGLQVLFNLEAIRYTLYSGEPIISGMMRLRPGANFWGVTYVAITMFQLCAPALGMAAAGVVFASIYGHAPSPGNMGHYVITYGVLLLTLVLLSLGGTVERTLERLSWWMIAFIFAFLLFVNVAVVPWHHSWQTLQGFLSFGHIPADMNWTLLAALAATAGSGGIGNLTLTNWVRDKGMGMGGRVGAIPSLVGGRKIDLSLNGKVFPVDSTNLARWRTWWKFVVVDQMWLWGVGCFIGMYLNVNLATAVTPAGIETTGMEAGVLQATYLAKKMGNALWYLGLLNGFWILFSTQLGNTDILVRTITDIVWVACPGLRESRRLNVGRLYFLLLSYFTLLGTAIIHAGTAMQLFTYLASVAGMVMVLASVQVLWINTTLLPPELRPSWWRRAGLVACALFYATVSVMMIKEKLGW